MLRVLAREEKLFANAVDDDLIAALFLEVNATATPLPATRTAPTITGNFIAIVLVLLLRCRKSKETIISWSQSERCDESHSLLGTPF